LAGIVLLAYYINERLRWGRIYITEILEMADDKLRITYMDKNEVKEYTGNKKSFSIERNSVRYRLKADKEQYLLFKDKDKGFTLKQYALGDWEDEKINELMEDWKPETPLALG
jgi:c-di-AMP phosphodiesterase-like protein